MSPGKSDDKRQRHGGNPSRANPSRTGGGKPGRTGGGKPGQRKPGRTGGSGAKPGRTGGGSGAKPSRSKPVGAKPAGARAAGAKPVEVMPLTGKQRRFLRAQGHVLDPVVLVGKDGITAALVGALDEALGTHELVKVKLGGNVPEARHDAAGELAARSTSQLVQVLGNTLLLYRADPDRPKIRLPRK